MPAYARSQIVPPDEVGIYHCIARCGAGRFFAVSIPSPSTITTIASNGTANARATSAGFRDRICGYAVMSISGALSCRAPLISCRTV